MRFLSLLTIMGKFPSLLAMADLQPLIVLGSCPGIDTGGCCYGFDRWCPEVHLITVAPFCKNGELRFID